MGVASLGAAYPTPFTAETIIPVETFRESPAGGARVEILAMDGRVVRALPLPSGAGGHPIVWDGRDGAGRALATGVYPYRLVLSSGAVAGRGRALLVR